MKNNDWKERLNVVYSTNPDFKYESVEEEAVETLDKKQQKLRVNIEKRTGWQNRDINQRVHRNRK
jgi:translation initiation factor 1 (eIF-1/SUI1)